MHNNNNDWAKSANPFPRARPNRSWPIWPYHVTIFFLKLDNLRYSACVLTGTVAVGLAGFGTGMERGTSILHHKYVAMPFGAPLRTTSVPPPPPPSHNIVASPGFPPPPHTTLSHGIVTHTPHPNIGRTKWTPTHNIATPDRSPLTHNFVTRHDAPPPYPTHSTPLSPKHRPMARFNLLSIVPT